MKKQKKIPSKAPKGLLLVEDLNLDQETFDIKLGEKAIQTTGPTCKICSECCLCETGGV